MNRSRGAALAMVIIAFAVLMILGTMVLSIALSETKFVAIDENQMVNTYTARSGAEAMVSYLISNPGKIQDMISKTNLSDGSPAEGELNGKTISIRVEGSVSNPRVVSSVIENGKEIDRVSIELKSSQFDFLSYSVFSSNEPTIGKNHKGDIGTNASSINRVGGKGATSPIEGDVRIVNGNSNEIDDIKNEIATGKKVINDITTHDIPPIDPSKFFADLGRASSFTLVDGEEKYMKTDLISGKVNGKIEFSVLGNGTLHLLVKDLGGNLQISVSDKAKLILYSESAAITFSGKPNLPCIIYAPNAKVEINGGGSGEVLGQVICKEYDSGNSNAFNFIEVQYDKLNLATEPSVSEIQRVNYSGE